MKAVRCNSWGPIENLVVEDVTPPIPARGEVLIAVQAASVNYPDVLIVQNKYQLKPPLPFTPGCEVVGVVTALGEDVANVQEGDRVIAFVEIGAFAEQAVASSHLVSKIPPDIDDGVAACISAVYGTSYHALLDRGQLKPGETVLIMGAAGGVGLAAVQIAKAVGARVIAAASSSEKLGICRANGADVLINYGEVDLRTAIATATDGKGPDVVFDPVGGAYSEQALRSIAWRGRFLVVGFASGTIPKIALNLALLKCASIVGVVWGNFVKREAGSYDTEMQALLQLIREGKLHPVVSAEYPLAAAAEAIMALALRSAAGKVVIRPVQTNGARQQVTERRLSPRP